MVAAVVRPNTSSEPREATNRNELVESGSDPLENERNGLAGQVGVQTAEASWENATGGSTPAAGAKREMFHQQQLSVAATIAGSWDESVDEGNLTKDELQDFASGTKGDGTDRTAAAAQFVLDNFDEVAGAAEGRDGSDIFDTGEGQQITIQDVLAVQGNATDAMPELSQKIDDREAMFESS